MLFYEKTLIGLLYTDIIFKGYYVCQFERCSIVAEKKNFFSNLTQVLKSVNPGHYILVLLKVDVKAIEHNFRLSKTFY